MGIETGSLGGTAVAGQPPPKPAPNTTYDPTYQGGALGGGYQWGIGQQQGVDTSGINAAQMPVTSVQQGQPYMQQMQDAYYQQGASRLDPQMQQQQSGLETQLANMGLTRGSQAWNSEMQRQAFNSNDAYAQLRNQSILNSGAEAQRLQGMDIAGGNFANQAAQQNYQNQLTSQQSQNAAIGQQFGQNSQQMRDYNAAMGQHQGNIVSEHGFQSQERTAAANQAAENARAEAQRQAQAAMQQQALQAAAQQQSQMLSQQKSLEEARMGQQAGQFGMTLKEQVAAREQAQALSTAQMGQQASQFGQSFGEQQASREQARALAEAQMSQQSGQFGQTLAEQVAAREQAQRLSEAQMAQQGNLAQGGWANRRDIAASGLAGQQAMASAQQQAAAEQASAARAIAQGQLDLQNRQFAQSTEHQAQFDPYLLEQMRQQLAAGSLGGAGLPK